MSELQQLEYAKESAWSAYNSAKDAYETALDRETQALIAKGLPPDRAKRNARLGNNEVARLSKAARDAESFYARASDTYETARRTAEQVPNSTKQTPTDQGSRVLKNNDVVSKGDDVATQYDVAINEQSQTQKPQYVYADSEEEFDPTINLFDAPPVAGTSDIDFLAQDDPLYEPVPTDDELASIQERMDQAEEDAAFAEIDEQFQNLPASQPPISIKDARAGTHPINDKDWRFRVQLSPFSDYLYNDPSVTAGHVLSPLKETDGVVFPYTPSISITNVANYQEYSPTHSNMKNYYYTGSAHEDLVVNADFTAQDTAEANYMLAVITFLKSATKMFYGQDAQRGTPPPLLYLNGFGEYAFSEHPVVLSRFAYTMPDNVDYISTADTGLTTEFVGKSDAGNSGASWSSKITRLLLSSLDKGAPPLLNNNSNIDLAGMTKVSGVSTYVPTRIRFDLIFKPVTTRKMQSEEFSLQDFASGKLIKKGYW